MGSTFTESPGCPCDIRDDVSLTGRTRGHVRRGGTQHARRDTEMGFREVSVRDRQQGNTTSRSLHVKVKVRLTLPLKSLPSINQIDYSQSAIK